jgi:hypothetical protein
MRKLLSLTLLCGVVIGLLSSCTNHEAQAIVRVLNDRNAALARSENPKGRNLNFVEYTAALRTIDTRGCPQKFLLAWQEYITVIASKRGFGILAGGPQDIMFAEGRLEDAAIDAGVKFDFSKNR